MSENRNNSTFPRDMDTLIGEINSRISQDLGRLINEVNSQIENAISSAISDRIFPQMQDVVEAVLARRLESLPATVAVCRLRWQQLPDCS